MNSDKSKNEMIAKMLKNQLEWFEDNPSGDDAGQSINEIGAAIVSGLLGDLFTTEETEKTDEDQVIDKSRNEILAEMLFKQSSDDFGETMALLDEMQRAENYATAKDLEQSENTRKVITMVTDFIFLSATQTYAQMEKHDPDDLDSIIKTEVSKMGQAVIEETYRRLDVMKKVI